MRGVALTALLSLLSGCFWIGEAAQRDRLGLNDSEDFPDDSADTDDTNEPDEPIPFDGQLSLHLDVGPAQLDCTDLDVSGSFSGTDDGPTGEGEADCPINVGPITIRNWSFSIEPVAEGSDNMKGELVAGAGDQQLKFDIMGILDTEQRIFRGWLSGDMVGPPQVKTREPAEFSVICVGESRSDVKHSCSGFEPSL